MTQTILSYSDDCARVFVRDASEHIQKHWTGGGFYEGNRIGMLPYIAANYDPGFTYLDIGASIGNHTLFFLSVMKAKKVIAIEPYPPSATHLFENVVLNDWTDRLSLHRVAASNTPGRLRMARYDGPTGTNNVGMVRVMAEGGFVVPAVTIDSIVGNEHIDVVKMDVEHFNAQVLEGASNLFDTQSADWFIEAENEIELKETDEIMTAHGYARTPDVKLNWTPTYEYLKQ